MLRRFDGLAASACAPSPWSRGCGLGERPRTRCSWSESRERILRLSFAPDALSCIATSCIAPSRCGDGGASAWNDMLALAKSARPLPATSTPAVLISTRRSRAHTRAAERTEHGAAPDGGARMHRATPRGAYGTCMAHTDVLVKAIVIGRWRADAGESGTGKSCLVHHFVDRQGTLRGLTQPRRPLRRRLASSLRAGS